jgi:uncharacterized protein
MNDNGIRLVYVDSSAFVKLVVPELESAQLRQHLRHRPSLISARLLRTEVLRAIGRAAPTRVPTALELLDDVFMVPLDQLCDQAGVLQPPELRSLDALHVAAALSLNEHLHEFITYDQRLAQAAQQHGLPVTIP